MIKKIYNCPCCNEPTLTMRGDYDICSNCNWEDDGIDNDEDYSGPNHMTLADGKKNYSMCGCCDIYLERVKRFLGSLYFGDRFCEDFRIENDKIIMQINCLSRLKEGTTEWNYYSKEDVEHGCIVFDGVEAYESDNNLPFNDEIYEIEVTGKEFGVFTFLVSGANVTETGIWTNVELQIEARRVYIMDLQGNIIF